MNNLDIEIESFSKEELEDLKNSKSIIESTERIKSVLYRKQSNWELRLVDTSKKEHFIPKRKLSESKKGNTVESKKSNT